MSQIISPEFPEFSVNEPVCPEVFAENPDAAFWVGRISLVGEIENAVYFDAVTKFRANVYVDELSFLPPEAVDVFGREIDEDDKRSTQFVAAENKHDLGLARIVGSGRLIHKRTDSDSLPIEQHFPEIFADDPIAADNVEVSRFIARYPEDPSVQRLISLSMVRAMALNSVEQGAPSTYCLIERPLQKLLTVMGLEPETLGEPKEIEELGGVLYPVRINPHKIVENAQGNNPKHKILRTMFSEDIDNKGLGFYPATLIGGK